MPISQLTVRKKNIRASFVWTSLHATQDLIRRGTRWKVGNGIGIMAASYPWIDDENNFFINTPLNQNWTDLRVADFINHDPKGWDINKLNQVFDQGDVSRIIKTALPPEGVEDRLVWHFSKDGIYSVKTAYRLATQLAFNPALEEPGDWNAIWKLKVPPKVQDFLWRVCRDCLPHKVNLRRKQVIADTICPMCEADIENTWHILINCKYATEVWKNSGLHGKMEKQIVEVEGMSDLVLQVLSTFSSSEAKKVGMILWQIWKERNNMVWDNKKRSPLQVNFAAAAYLYEWEQSRGLINTEHQYRTTTQQDCGSWHAPTNGYLKMNVDAAFFEETHQTGIGIVLRNEQSNLISAKTIVMNGCIEVKVGEAMGFYEALSWIKNMQLENVIVEGDAKIVVEAIHSSSSNMSVFGDYIKACKQILNSLSNCSISYVKRSANSWAHEFAKVSRFYENPHLWNDPPSFVAGLPNISCSCEHFS